MTAVRALTPEAAPRIRNLELGEPLYPWLKFVMVS
jgi:hypothetical protein